LLSAERKRDGKIIVDGGKIEESHAHHVQNRKKLRYEKTCRHAAISGRVRGFPFGKSAGFDHRSAPYVLCCFYLSFALSPLLFFCKRLFNCSNLVR